MAKIRSSTINRKEKEILLESVFDVVKTLRRKDDIIAFFKELLFDSEIIMFGRRLKIVKLLLEGATYGEIQKELKVGINTIAAVRFGLDRGSGQLLKALKQYFVTLP